MKNDQIAAAPSSLGFGRQVQPLVRLADKVVEALLEAILEQGLRPGDPLPPERELCEHYGVSRPIMREALRALTSRGVIEAHAGRRLTVAQVAAEEVSATLRLYFHGRNKVPFVNINEVRAGIEIQIAELAAERASPLEIEQLRDNARAMREVESDREKHSLLDLEFHRLLARMTHNDLFLIMLDSISPLLLEIRRATFRLPNDPLRAYNEHVAIVDAVARGDCTGARHAMRDHLNHAEAEWRMLEKMQATSAESESEVPRRTKPPTTRLSRSDKTSV
jgi:GntR family transcriptional repressor for pyruvate dehydrogenase complex